MGIYQDFGEVIFMGEILLASGWHSWLLRYLVAESWLGPAISALQGAVPSDRRGTAQAVVKGKVCCANLLGAWNHFAFDDP